MSFLRDPTSKHLGKNGTELRLSLIAQEMEFESSDQVALTLNEIKEEAKASIQSNIIQNEGPPFIQAVAPIGALDGAI